MVGRNEDPVVQSRRLRGELRELRRAMKQTQAQVADAMDWSSSKVIRMESGDGRITVSDLRALLSHYRVTDAKRVDRLIEMARNTRNDPWQEFKDVHQPTSLKFFGFEGSSSLIRDFSPALVPGLLQTEEYAKALLAQTFGKEKFEIERRWEARAKRQELHDRSAPPDMFFVFDEAVVRREVGGPGVMRRQLERLVERSRERHISIRVIPFRAGAHPGMTGPFVVMEFPNRDDDDVLYLEHVGGEKVTRDDPQVTETYVDEFFKLERAALSEDDTRALLGEIIDDLAARSAARQPASAGTSV
jgi:transcriptional regulator with XRE-family HTH domain